MSLSATEAEDAHKIAPGNLDTDASACGFAYTRIAVLDAACSTHGFEFNPWRFHLRLVALK
jgi:hypothetical protein